MDYKDWLLKKGYSESSIKKYYGAITGPITEWAGIVGLTNKNLIDITDFDEFDSLSKKINDLPVFKKRNSTGNHMYSRAIETYADFLKSAVTREDLICITGSFYLIGQAKQQLQTMDLEFQHN